MKSTFLTIKNMVCPRCISAVEDLLNDLQLSYSEVKLGLVSLDNPISNDQLNDLSIALKSKGFELLTTEKSSLITQIKSAIITQIHHSKEPMQENFSTYLTNRLHHEYTSLSKLFSSVEGITIEKFITAQKIEKAKELIYYKEMSLAEIAFQLNYSSAAYLSAQFKKETGMTPSEFKNQSEPHRKSLDSF